MKNCLSLSEFRAKHGLTQVQLAAMLDITAEYVSMIENGKKTASKKILNKLGLIDNNYSLHTITIDSQSDRHGIKSCTVKEKGSGYGKHQCLNCVSLNEKVRVLQEHLDRANALLDVFIKNEKSKGSV